MSEEMRPLEDVLGDSMGEVFDKMDAEEPATGKEASPPETPPEDAATAGTLPDGETTEQEPEAPETAATGEETPESKPEDQPGAEGADESLSPPERWSQEDRDSFSTLPAEAQALVLKREADVERHLTQKSQEIAEQKRGFAELEQLLEPRRQLIAQQGLNQTQYLGNILQLADFASSDPAGFVKWFAQQRGIGLDGLSEDQAGSGDPELAAITSRMDAFERSQQQAHQQNLQAEQTNATAVVDAWAAKDGHEHYKEVEAAMTGILPDVKRAMPGATPEALLEEAYNRSIWAVPSIREKLQASERKTEESKRLETAKKAAAKAKKAGVNATATGAPSGGERKTQSMDETMAAKYDELNAA